MTALPTGLFTVVTVHGTCLRCNPGGADAFHGPMATGAGSDLLLFVPPAAPNIGFLMPPLAIGTMFRIAPDAPASIHPFRLRRKLGSDATTLCHPFTGRFLCAGLQTGDTEGALVTDRLECEGWETFRLIPAAPASPTDAIARTAAALTRWAARPITGPEIYSLIEAGVDPQEGPAFDAFCRLLPYDQLVWLGPTILGRPEALATFRQTFPDDVFAAQALPELRTWLATRPKAITGHVPSDLDDLATIGLDGHYVSFGHMCNAFARRAVPPSKQVCVLATARNEGPYLLEWIAYHRSIGVDGFFIYSNDNNDGSDQLLAALARARVITWIRNELKPGAPAQPKAYGHALGILPDVLDYRWALIIDLDEFFAFDRSQFDTIGAFIDWQEARPVDAIALNWLVYGSSGQNCWREAPVTSRFTNRLPWLDPHIKTMVRTSQVIQSRPHHPTIDMRQTLVTRNASGLLHKNGQSPSFSAEPEVLVAWINHYFLKSAEEFLWKFSRNRGDHALVEEVNLAAIDEHFLDMFVSQHESPHVTQDDRIAACSSELGKHILQLRALDGVDDAMRLVGRRFAETIAQLKEQIAELPSFRTPGTHRAKLAEFLGVRGTLQSG